jgi:hypothetical protein
MLETQATPSEATNNLIDLASRLLNGEEGVGEKLDQSLATQMAIVESELELVPARANERGEAFLEQFSELYSALLTHMNLYYEGLLELAAYFDAEQPDPHHLENGVGRLLEVTGDLVAVQQAYGQAFSGFGPSRFPVVNTLDRLLSEYRKNQEVSEELEHVTQMMIDSFQQRLSTVSDDETGADETRSGCQRAIAALTATRAGYADHSTHEKHIKALGEALFEMETAVEEDRLALAEGPSSMPAANVFINIARRALAGKIPKEAVGPALNAYVEHITSNWEVIEAQLEKPIDSATVQEELPNTMELVDAHEDIMDRLLEIYEADFDPVQFEDGLKELIELVNEFQNSAQVFIEAAERAGKHVCVTCGRANPKANNVCEECGAALPKLQGENEIKTTIELTEQGGLDDETRMVMTTNIARIFKACDDFFNQEIEVNEFIGTMEWAKGLLAQMRMGLTKLEAEIAQFGSEDDPKSQEEKTSLMEVAAYFDEGIDEWDAGLDEMLRFLDDPIEHHFKSGKKRVWEGASAIHRCRVIGDAANERLAELQAQANDDGVPKDKGL